MPSIFKKTVSLLLALTGAAWDTSAAAVSIDFVTVGNAGNAADHAYQIGRTEVTNGQYAKFLNAVAATDSYFLYNPKMADYGILRSSSADGYRYEAITALVARPVAYVSVFDAARFCNWLANGQGTGSTENGSYILNGALSGRLDTYAGATVYLPSENEWYKAAYYNPTSSSYSLFANGKNVIGENEANFSTAGSVDAGSYPDSPSAYGTLDQSGNMVEWTSGAVFEASQVLRGGGWCCGSVLGESTYRAATSPQAETFYVGFRIAGVVGLDGTFPESQIPKVPEPGPLTLALLASGGLLWRRKRGIRP